MSSSYATDINKLIYTYFPSVLNIILKCLVRLCIQPMFDTSDILIF